MSRVDELRAELELAELEAEMISAKGKKGAKPDELADLKAEVRAARKAAREAREG